MKVIKPTEVVKGSYTNINSRDVVPIWSAATTYGASSTFDKIWVQYNGAVYESIKPNNQGNIPNSTSTWWRTITTLSIDDFAKTVWSSTQEYSSGDVVYYESSATSWPRYYQSIQNSNVNKIPPDNLTGTSPAWLDLGYANIGKLYDLQSSTQTIGTEELIATFKSRKAAAAGIFNTEGANNILVTAKAERNIYNNNSWTYSQDLTSSSQQINSLSYIKEKNILLLCGNNGLLKYSTNNGINWQNCNIPDTVSNINSVAYSKTNRVFVAVGTNTSSNTKVIWKSFDGVDWTTVQNLPVGGNTLNKVIYISTNGTLFAIGNSGRYFTSSDGTTWTERVNGSYTFIDVFYNSSNGLLHVLTSSSNTIFYTSDITNFSSWTSMVLGPSVSGVYSFRSISAYIKSSNTGSTTIQYLITAIRTDLGNLSVALTSSTGLTLSWAANTLNVPSNQVTDATYCYTENKWVILCSGTALSWSGVNGEAQSVVTPINFDSTRSKIYYNASTDTLFLHGNNTSVVTSSVTYFREYKLNTVFVNDWSDYFFTDSELLPEAIVENIPTYTENVITISLIGDIVRCGVAFGGISYTLGTTQYGASAGIIDYSKKETDEFGTTTFIQRSFSKRMNVNIILPSTDLYRVQKILSDVRASPCAWIGSDDDTYRPLTMYGYYRDFNLEIPYPEYSYCSLQVEGLTE